MIKVLGAISKMFARSRSTDVSADKEGLCKRMPIPDIDDVKFLYDKYREVDGEIAVYERNTILEHPNRWNMYAMLLVHRDEIVSAINAI